MSWIRSLLSSSSSTTHRKLPRVPVSLPRQSRILTFPSSSPRSQNYNRLFTTTTIASHSSATSDMSGPKAKSEEEWRAVLSPEQVCFFLFRLRHHHRRTRPCCNSYLSKFRILRQKGTEPAGKGKYDPHYEEGVYTCAACETPFYKSKTKFKSGCGWPAFYDGECLSRISCMYAEGVLWVSHSWSGVET